MQFWICREEKEEEENEETHSCQETSVQLKNSPFSQVCTRRERKEENNKKGNEVDR